MDDGIHLPSVIMIFQQYRLYSPAMVSKNNLNFLIFASVLKKFTNTTRYGGKCDFNWW